MNIIVGISLVIVSTLNGYYASKFKRSNYIFGLLNYLLMGYVAFKNNIYGMFIFYIFIFSPMQLVGFINWKKNQDNNKNVIVRAFSRKNRIILITTCIVFSLVLASILNRIPNAKFTYLDSFSNIINLSGVILMILRFNESWLLWLINNIIDLIIWSNVVIIGGSYSIFMLISSIIYLIINIYGIIKWDNRIKENINNVLKISTIREIEIIAYIANIVSLICYIIVGKKIAIIIAIFGIIQLTLNRIFKNKSILSCFYILITILSYMILRPESVELLIVLCLLFYSFIPIIKQDKYIRFIGLINIILFTIYDIYIKLYNLVFLDLFIIVIFIYGIYINDIIKNRRNTSKSPTSD